MNRKPPASLPAAAKGKTRTLGFRFILLFTAITIPLLLLLFAASYYAKTVVLKQVAVSYRNLVTSNLHMIDRSLDDITTNMVNIVDHDDNFQKFARPGLTDTEAFFVKSELTEKNKIYQSYYHTVDLFYVYSQPNDVLDTSFLMGQNAVSVEQVREWLYHTLHNPQALKELYYKWSIVQINGQYFLHRMVANEPGNNAYIGALIHINTLKLPLGALNLSNGEVVFTADDGTVLSRPSAIIADGTRLPSGQLADGHAFSYTQEGKKLFVIASRSSTSPVHMAVVLPNSELLRGLNNFQMMINLLPLAVGFILLLYLFIFRRIVYYPILQLLNVIRRIKEGDMEARLPPSPVSEFETINHTFNSMVSEIGELKIDVYEERLNVQSAELKHLQTQINPHFFLNTLNIIYQLAELKRFDLVKKTVRHMVQYFRFMLSKKADTITLGQELEHIRNYLEIQKLRYQDAFTFDITAEESLLGVKLPSLLIQPFVENAMLHGLTVKSEVFTLHVSARRWPEEANTLVIEVQDNGRGMDGQVLQLVNSSEYAPDSEEGHIGIWNVKRRMAMRYGDSASVLFAHNSPRGVTVRLTLPMENEEEEPGYGRHAGG